MALPVHLALFVSLLSAPLSSFADDNEILDGFVAREYQSGTEVKLPYRLYVVGQSLGGFGAWDLIARHPDVFAAAVPLCGGGDTKLILSARDVAVWAFHGAKDATVLASRSREMVAALRTVNSSVRYTEYPEVGHDVWTRAFAERDLPEWMFAQRRR